MPHTDSSTSLASFEPDELPSVLFPEDIEPGDPPAIEENRGNDNVNTKGETRRAKGTHPAFAIQPEKNAAGNRLRVAELARLVCIERMSFREAAKAMDLSYHHVVRKLWPEVKAMSSADHMSMEEKDRVTDFLVDTLQHVIRTATDKIGESAAYGMVAINGCKQLADLHGIDLSIKSGAGGEGVLASLEEVADQVLQHAPLLSGQIDLIRKIQKQGAVSAAVFEAARTDLPKEDEEGG